MTSRFLPFRFLYQTTRFTSVYWIFSKFKMRFARLIAPRGLYWIKGHKIGKEMCFDMLAESFKIIRILHKAFNTQKKRVFFFLLNLDNLLLSHTYIYVHSCSFVSFDVYVQTKHLLNYNNEFT